MFSHSLCTHIDWEHISMNCWMRGVRRNSSLNKLNVFAYDVVEWRITSFFLFTKKPFENFFYFVDKWRGLASVYVCMWERKCTINRFWGRRGEESLKNCTALHVGNYRWANFLKRMQRMNENANKCVMKMNEWRRIISCSLFLRYTTWLNCKWERVQWEEIIQCDNRV